MPRIISMAQAREQLTRLPEEFAREPEPGAVTVTRRGKPVLAVLPWDLYESVVETLEIMGDADLMTDLRQGLRELADGRGIPWEKARKALDR